MANIQTSVLYKWFNQVWNQGDESAIDRLMTEDCKAHGITPDDQPGGPAGFKRFYKEFTADFSNIRVELEQVVSEEDSESARMTVYATHTPTQKNVTFTGICMVRTKNGKIAEAWNNYDFLGMQQQLGQTITSGTPV